MPCTRTHSLPRSTIASLLVGLVVLCAAPGAHAQRVATGRIKIGVDSGGGGGGGGPANPANSVQFNNGGAFGGSANLTFNPGTGILTTNEVSPLTDASFSLGEIALNWTKVFTAAIQNGVSGDATGIAVNDSLGMVATSWYEHTHGSLVLTNPASAQALTGGHIDISTAGNTSWSIPETGARDGQWTVVCNTSAFNVTLVNQAGIYIGSCVMAQNQCASMFYSNSQWQQLTCDGDIAPGPAPTNGAVQFNNGGLFGGDAATFFWDNTSKFLGIGTNTPADPINIFGGPAFQGGLRVNGPVDGVRQILLDNPSAGTSALASLVVANDISSSHRVLFEYLGTNFTPVGLRTGQQGSLLSTGSGGMIIGTFPAGGSAAGDVIFVRGGTSAVNQRINLASTETSINTNQQVVNFRVASVAGANGIFVDGTSGLVGIGTNVPTTALTVAGTITPLTNATSSLGTSALNWTTSFAAAIQNGTSGDATGIAVNDSLGMVATSWYEHTHGSIVLTNPASAQALTGGHINVSEAGDTSWSIPETSARDGQWTVVCNTSAFNVTLVPQAGIYVGSCVMAQNQCASMIYSNSQWTQLTCDGDIAPGPAPTNGAVQFNNAGLFGGDASNFFWNNGTKRLGIGTATPASQFDVRGAFVTTSSTQAGQVNIATTGAETIDQGGTLTLGGNTDAGGTVFGVFGTVEGRKHTAVAGNGAGYLAFNTTSSAGVLGERMRIDPTGEVAIGIINPTARLHVVPTANEVATKVTGYSVTGANTTSLDSYAGTWNTSGAPTAILLNITDTASSASSLLADFQIGGITQWNVTKGGAVTETGTLTINGPALSITTGTNQNLQLVANGTGVIQLNDAVTVGGDMTPDGDSTRQLGSGALHWLRLFVTNLQGNGGIVTVEADLDPDGNGTRALGIVSTQEWLSLATATVKTNFTKGLDLTSQNANGDVTATSARNIILDTPSANFVTIGTGSHANELRPAQDLAQALGDSTHRWANIFTGGIVTARVAVSCPNNGGGTPSTLTLQPQNAGVIEITNNDPDGCVVTVSETAATLGLQTRIIVVASAGGFTTFASQANVLALSGAFAMQIADSLVIEYANTADPEYIENSRSNN